jgi:hypothetical protein
MRRFVTLGATALLAGCAGGTLTGHVIVGATGKNLVVYASVWSVESEPSNPKVSDSSLIPKPGGSTTAIGTIAIGTSNGKGQTFNYTFQGLQRGLYIVGAFLDDAADIAPDLNFLTHTIDSASVLEVDPARKSLQEVKHDVYLGISAPGTGTIKGTVHLSTRAAAQPVNVLVLSGTILDPSGQLVMQQGITGGPDAAFSLFNVPLGDAFLLADAGTGGTLQDLLGFPIPSNPVQLSAQTPEADNIDIWVDRQAPGLGLLSGQVLLNAPVSNATVQMFIEEGGIDSNLIVGAVNVPVSGSTAAFTIPSLPLGDMFVLSETGWTQSNGEQLAGPVPLGYYPGLPNPPAGIKLTQSAPAAMNVAIPIGVGQVLGEIALTNVPADTTAVWVLACGTENLPNPDTQSSQQVPAGAAVYSIAAPNPAPFSYDIFGLMDGTYTIRVFPVPSESTDPTTATGCPGQPAAVTIVGGSRESSAFQLSLPCASPVVGCGS